MAEPPVRQINYYVVGQGDMNLTDRSTWFVSASNATTIQGLKSDLHGEPFVPKHYAISLANQATDTPTGWTTEKVLLGRPLPEGTLDVRIIPMDSKGETWAVVRSTRCLLINMFCCCLRRLRA